MFHSPGRASTCLVRTEWLASIIVAIGKDRRDIDVTEPKAKAVGMFKHRE